MRFSLLPLLPVVALLASCSGSTHEQQTTTATETMADTAEKVVATPAKPVKQPAATPPPARPAKVALAPDTANVQSVAAYLGGLPPHAGTPLAALATQPSWQAFAKDQDKSWVKYRTTHTDPMSRWAATELDSVRQASPTIFYPFSGPDFLNVFTMFPTSSTYVMFGLEPVGSVPAHATLEDPTLLPAVKASLWSVLNFSFFRTNDMAVELKSVHLDGAVPLIMLFAARTGNHLQSVRPVELDAQGKLHEVAAADTAHTASQSAATAKAIPGAELKLQAADGTEKTIYYFSADLSDWKLNTKSAPLRYMRSLGPLTTYVKSATYLMHKSYFSKVRNLILERSNYLLQDDSGIAMRYFPKNNWQFTYYGTYKRPINLFAKQYQPELTTAYHDTLHRARPLPFGTGYNWRQTDSNLLLARRRTLITK
jgi:nuclear transport factor 2 (NTF2) superfamily protein